MFTTTGATAPVATSAMDELDETATNTITEVGSDTASTMTDAALAAVEDGEVNLQAAESFLDPSEATVHSVDTKEGTFTTVTVPVNGEYSLTSNFSAVFDSSTNLVQYAETLVSENESGNFNVSTYTDGALTSDQDTDIAFMTDAELELDMAKSQPDPGSEMRASNTGPCLAAVLGISGVVGGIIAYACAGACASAAAGIGVPLCVGCVSGFAVVGGASITGVASCF